MDRKIHCATREGGYALTFNAMASPCELLIDIDNKALAILVGEQVAHEAWRIEDKYSRYQVDSACGQLNARAGQICDIDEETFLLLQFADQCFQMSQGLFDITSGVLRKVWHFDGSDNIPSVQEVEKVLPFIGWKKVTFDQHSFHMQSKMEIDFGGIGKEYAVDKALLIAQQLLAEHQQGDCPLLINFGGDLAVSGPRANNVAWTIGVEHPSLLHHKSMIVNISHGAIATSGDANRFLLKNGKRYSHILNVQTGWPVENPPKSVTVAAPKCIQAGLLSTLALLQGQDAGNFLTSQEITHWLIE